MYSDIWRTEGEYAKKEIARLGKSVSLAIFERDGEILGYGLDFDIADDFHYELLSGDWLEFASHEFGTIEMGIVIENMSSRFEEDGLFWFERALDNHRIEYAKIAFY